jgi:putative intracellular protease/amidase
MSLTRKIFVAAMATALLTGAAAGAQRSKPKAKPKPVLMVIANQDFYYQEYNDVRASLEAQGLDVVVAAATTEVARPQGPGRRVRPDIALTDVEAEGYSGIAFVGGWGASSYQYAFPGTYNEPAYRPSSLATLEVNRLIKEFSAGGKPVGAVCYGVSVLAWARVDGTSPIAGRTVSAFAGGAPGFRFEGQEYPDATVPVRWQIEANGATMPLSAALGDPLTAEDDVVVDGHIITAENYDSAARFGRAVRDVIDGGGRQRK